MPAQIKKRETRNLKPPDDIIGGAMKGSLAENTQPLISLRPVQLGDEGFLYEVYACTRADELAHVAWDEAQRRAFLSMQLRARDQSYRMHYAEFDDQIILINGKNAGRLMIVRTGEEIRLADITLLPEYRGSGLGASLIKDLMTVADSSDKPLRLQ